MNEELDLIFDLAKESMSNAITHLEKKLMNIRAGKANPNMLSNVTIEYYGTNTPLSQVANINTPDGRTIIIQPWEKTILPEIEKGIEIILLIQSQKFLPKLKIGNFTCPTKTFFFIKHL